MEHKPLYPYSLEDVRIDDHHLAGVVELAVLFGQAVCAVEKTEPLPSLARLINNKVG